MRVKRPESARDRNRSLGGTAVSTLVHALLIGGTVLATGSVAERALEPKTPERLVYVTPDRPVPNVPEPPKTPPTGHSHPPGTGYAAGCGAVDRFRHGAH